MHPYLRVILAVSIGATAGIWTKLLHLPATQMSFFRLAVPALIVLLYLKVYKKRTLVRAHARHMVAASALNAVRVLLYFAAYLYTSLGNAVIMLYTWPIFAVLWARVILKEKMTGSMKLLLFLSFAGVAIMYGPQKLSVGNSDLIGMSAMMLSAALYALSAVIFKKYLHEYSDMETVFYQNSVGAVLFFPFLFLHPFPAGATAGFASLYAFAIGIIGFWLIYSALRKITMVEYGVLSYWEVIGGVLFGMFIFGETLTPHMMFGGALILASGILLIAANNKRAPKNAP